MQLQKDLVRSTTSCTECQRRKQKCSRDWPCNHCQARKVPHLCQFGPKKVQQASPPESAREVLSDARSRKRSFPDSSDNSNHNCYADDEEQPEDGLKIWGYMPGHVHYNLNQNGEDEFQRKDSSTPSTPNVVEKVLHAIPPRSITDTFVNHFLTIVNYRYSAIYPPTFTDNYVTWWSNRINGDKLSPEFTCLLLRVLAYSVQYLTLEQRKMIEFELACDSQTLTERFSFAADDLSKSFTASSSCVERVQEQFLRGVWLKSESRIVESWHALGRTIHEAQELGIDKDTSAEALSEFDIEIRRRLWALLFIWDWQMSAWLGRPHLIDQKDLSFVFPNLRLETNPSEPNLLSPFAHMALQAQLARRIAPLMGDVKVASDITIDHVNRILAEINKFINELPPVFQMAECDCSLDKKYPFYVFQRYQLHVVLFVTMLDFLKPYLSADPRRPRSSQDEEFRKQGVDIGLKLLKVARKLFDHEFPINAKFHMVVFCIFDTGTILCSAVIHDIYRALPRREEVIKAIGDAMSMLQLLSHTTKLGASSHHFLYKLVQATPDLQFLVGKQKRLRKHSGTSSEAREISPPHTMLSIALPPAVSPRNIEEIATNKPLAILDLPLTENLAFDAGHFMAQNPWWNPSNSNTPLDMGGMEQIWDWDGLNIEQLQRSHPPSSQA